jgi:hypothetical protein
VSLCFGTKREPKSSARTPRTPKAFHAKPCPAFAFIRVIRGQNLGCNVAQASCPQRRASQTIIFACGLFCFTGALLPENLAAIKPIFPNFEDFWQPWPKNPEEE